MTALACPSAIAAIPSPASLSSGKARNRLWVCCHFPELPLEIVLKAIDSKEPPIAVFEQVRGKLQVAMASIEAQEQGVRTGLGINAALALCPALLLLPRDMDGESAALNAMADHCIKHFTPWVSLDRPQSLLLEVEGSLKLWGGLAALLDRLVSYMSSMGHRAVLATTPASFASWLLASQGVGSVVGDAEELRSALGNLPVLSMGLSGKLNHRLSLAGIHRLRDLWRLPRAGLIRRYGMQVVQCRDRALGLAPDLPSFFMDQEGFHAALDMPLESRETAHCWTAIELLLKSLMTFLTETDGAIASLLLELHHPGGIAPTALPLEMRKASRDSAYLGMLLREKLDRIRISAPVRSISLSCEQIQRFTPELPDLFGHRLADCDQWERLLEALRARLGSRALKFFASHEDHRPERAYTLSDAPSHNRFLHDKRRPLWLLTQPQPAPSRLKWDEGVERIESGWWDLTPTRRDYRTARDRQGRRWWAYRDRTPDGTWHLQGLFG